ncbi:glycogen debranching protein GlgX [uncultured Amnibacterium sp.]|uniref:glycogen debranching protein GlgX n=1 Tax=uncultured Amnibacterium sp. TaxID=1631851 RepID=UPI0035C9ECA2
MSDTSAAAAPAVAAALDPLHDLGVRATSEGGEIRVFSATARRLELCLFDERDSTWVEKSVRLQRDEHGVWSGRSPLLTPGRRYSLRAAGPSSPRDDFDRGRHLLDPYARGIAPITAHSYRGVVVDGGFDWGGITKPGTPMADSVIYEAHVKGLTKQLRSVPAQLRGTYAGLAHESTIAYLKDLGVTAVELLPVQAFTSEQRLLKQGLANYWGYNPVGYFAPHTPYASRSARAAGPAAVLTEFKGMVRLLHAAGLEVILDVVYNHTAEEGAGGVPFGFRGLDNATYYRQDHRGRYIDTTGCGNTLDASQPAVQRLVLDSLRYWATELQVDGFRFDLAVTLGRDESGAFRPDHPLLTALAADPALTGVKLIAEPWDTGQGGWQTGGFPAGWSEWNDRYRDGVRDFWLADAAVVAGGGYARSGRGAIANRLAGSSEVFPGTRGPTASVNFVTAHDGFTLADLTTYQAKRNLGNGESNRDGTDNNRSYNFGTEGTTRNEAVLAGRRRAMRNLLGTLLLSAGVPMLLAGDEIGRTQRGNNNAYCHDATVTWLNWNLADWQQDLHDVVRRLLTIRREHAALRPTRYAERGARSAAVEMHWFDGSGEAMTEAAWGSIEDRTLQYYACTRTAAGTSQILLVVHGATTAVEVRLPEQDGVDSYDLLWSSADDGAPPLHLSPAAEVWVEGPTLLVFMASDAYRV